MKFIIFWKFILAIGKKLYKLENQFDEFKEI
jgi:hypothetical protein